MATEKGAEHEQGISGRVQQESKGSPLETAQGILARNAESDKAFTEGTPRERKD